MSRRTTVTEMDVFTPDEVAYAAGLLRERSRASDTDKLRLLVWNLACCCGLRASEIAGVRAEDVLLLPRGRYKPNLYIAASVAKRGGGVERARRVPLTWVPWLIQDLRDWLEARARVPDIRAQDPLAVRLSGTWSPRKVWGPGRARIVAPGKDLAGQPLDRHDVRDAFVQVCKLADLKGRRWTTHTGRHTFVTHALASGIPAASVRDAAGHSSLAVTDIYAHAAAGDRYDGRLYSREGGGQ